MTVELSHDNHENQGGASGRRLPRLSLQNNSLRVELIGWLLLVGIIPLIVASAISYVQARGLLGDSVESEVQSVTDLTEDRVQRWMNSRAADAQTYSSMQFATGDENGALDLGLRVLTNSDVENESSRTTAERSARRVLPDIVEATGGSYEAIYLTNAEGLVLIGVQNRLALPEEDRPIRSRTGHHEGHSFAEDGFFQFAINSGGLSRSDVLQYSYATADGTVNRVTTMFIAHGITDSNTDELVGTIILEVSQDELQSLMDTFANGDGATYLESGDFLVSHDSIIAALPDSEADRSPDDESGVDEFEGFESDGNVLGSWIGNTALNYVVYGQVPVGTALSDVNGLLLTLGGVAILLGVIVAFASFFIARKITVPIVEIRDAARAFSRGELDARVNVSGGLEIVQLGDDFNEMMDNLEVSLGGEKQNREYLEDVLTSYMRFVERVSRGDLTARLSLNGQTGANLIVANVNVDQDDNLLRLGYNLNRMVEALHSMASQTRDVASSLSEAAVEILDSSTKQIASTTQQDASVTQTTSTVTEVRATVAETAERAQMVAEAAQQSVEISRQGQHAVAETIEGMNLIRSRVESIAENILMLSERTTQIGDIIATVNSIADQSKMLALNASIEAARAGEEGRGFSVVAMEVRNLAEQSREATAQVRDILSEIQQATNTAVMVTEEGTKGVDLGVQLVDRAGRAIRELAGKLEDAAQAAMQIAASTRQQSQGMDQLTSAMTSIKAATSSTATSMQQSQRNAKDLNEMARQMESAISQYKL